MTEKKSILLVSATGRENYELAQELKEIIDNAAAVFATVINLESYDLPLYRPGIEIANKTAQKLSGEFESTDGFVFCAPEYNGGACLLYTSDAADE